MEQLRYPIGRFEPVFNVSVEQRGSFIRQIPGISADLRTVVKDLSGDQLHIPYRADGWTVTQIVHHLADNDMNAYLRFKRALTEDNPMSDSYREDLWAQLNDYRDVPIDISLALLENLHARFYILLNGLHPDDYQRTLRTVVLGQITVDTVLQRFIWHNYHHMSQIQSLINRGWRQ